MSTPSILLPGDTVPVPAPASTTGSKKPLRVGPGLTLSPAPAPPSSSSSSGLTATRAGPLLSDPRKNAFWLDSDSRRYVPSPQDAVLGVVLRSTSDSYILSLPSSTSPAPASIQATLPHLAFPGATKKTRPVLAVGALVYARVSNANKHFDPELECFNAETGKADGFGELKGGLVVGVSLGVARRLLGDGKKVRRLLLGRGEAGGAGGGGGGGGEGKEVLEEIGGRVPFECAVGRNGRVWVLSESVRKTICVARCIVESQGKTVAEVRAMVAREVRKLEEEAGGGS